MSARVLTADECAAVGLDPTGRSGIYTTDDVRVCTRCGRSVVWSPADEAWWNRDTELVCVWSDDDAPVAHVVDAEGRTMSDEVAR